MGFTAVGITVSTVFFLTILGFRGYRHTGKGGGSIGNERKIYAY